MMGIVYTRRNLIFAGQYVDDLVYTNGREAITLDVRQFNLMIEALRNVV
jgi:hypothetical protein